MWHVPQVGINHLTGRRYRSNRRPTWRIGLIDSQPMVLVASRSARAGSVPEFPSLVAAAAGAARARSLVGGGPHRLDQG
jgi:hypothetical protein